MLTKVNIKLFAFLELVINNIIKLFIRTKMEEEL